jgi:transposase
MARTSRYPQDVRDRAVRLVLDHRGQYASEWQAITSIAPKVGVHPETLWLWVRRTQIDKGERPGLTTEERERLMQLERENRELRPCQRSSRAPQLSSGPSSTADTRDDPVHPDPP